MVGGMGDVEGRRGFHWSSFSELVRLIRRTDCWSVSECTDEMCSVWHDTMSQKLSGTNTLVSL